MTRVGGPIANAAAFAQTAVTEQNLTKTRLRKTRLRKAALMRAMQKRELDHARQLRERALAKRGIAKFSVSKAAKERARPHAHAEHNKLPSLRKRQHDAHPDIVQRRHEREQGRGGQQRDGQSDQQQQQQQQGDHEEEQGRKQQAQAGDDHDGGKIRRGSVRITARAGATGAAALSSDVIAKAVAALGGDQEQAEETALQRYFEECDRIGNEARSAPSSPKRSPEEFTDQQYFNLADPLRRIQGYPYTDVQLQEAINRTEGALRLIAGNQAPAPGIRNFGQQMLAARLDLLKAMRDHQFRPHATFDDVKAHLSAKSEADATRR